MNKKLKGISPLIATVLIIIVAVVLVGILLSWSQNFVQTNTSNADSAIDTSCSGAALNFMNCDYNSIGDKLFFTIVNSGDIIFKADQNINVTLVDSNYDLNNSNLNVLDSNALGLGESALVVIEGYEGISPIKVQVRSTQCNGYFWEKTCK